jgi:hypothetical protein
LGGELFVVGSDQQAIGQLGAATDNHFTVLVFTAATSEPIMVVVILKSDKSRDMIPLNWSMGLDYLKIKESADGHDLDNIALMQENKDVMCGWPTCVFCGKNLQSHVYALSYVSITSKMIAEMLNDIDCSGVFGRLPGTTVDLNYCSYHTLMVQNTPGLFTSVFHTDAHLAGC